MLVRELLANRGSGELFSVVELTDGLLEPDQETVDAVLRAENNHKERPEILKMATDFFDSSRKASGLCGALLRCIHEMMGQCRSLDVMLAEMPRSGEALGLPQQSQMVEGLRKMAEARNPFSETETNRMFEDVRASYGALNGEVEERRKAIGKKVRVLKRWNGGGIAIVVAVVAGVIAIAVVVATHAAASVAAAPVAAAAARRGGNASSWCRLGLLRKESAKLDAMARGSFTVNRMLDTLSCLVVGLHDDVERNRRLVEFGMAYGEEALCVQQVAKQLCRSHLHLVQQLANLQEQVSVCFRIINKARDSVFQEFCPSPRGA